MRKLCYILSLLLVFSCMNKAEKSEAVSNKEVEIDSDMFKVNEAAIIDAKATIFTEQDIAFQKLQEFYDLNLLKLHHPEFEEDISKQIAEISNSNLDLPKLARQVQISNLKQIEAMEFVDDSVSKLKLSYEVVSDQGIKKDTIIAILKSTITKIENREQKAYKVKFEKY